MSSSEEFELLKEDSYQDSKRKTTEYMSIYEYTALVSARAAFITNTGDTNELGDQDPVEIAKKDVLSGNVSLIIRRRLPDGSFEDWRPKDMIFPRM